MSDLHELWNALFGENPEVEFDDVSSDESSGDPQLEDVQYVLSDASTPTVDETSDDVKFGRGGCYCGYNPRNCGAASWACGWQY